jgi:hypothetical protein
LCGVATFDSHWSCPVSSGRTASRRLGYCYVLREPPNRRANGGTIVRMLKPVDPALFLSRAQVDPFKDRSRPGTPLEPTPGSLPFGLLPLGFKGPCVQRPNATTSQAAWRPHFRARSDPHFASRNSSDQSRQALPPRPQPGGGVISSGALLGATGGTQTHSRRTGRKLGRLRYARQGLVRVPESNTKYGGLAGITGGNPAPVIEPSISESTRIPKQKNICGGCGWRLRPAVHRRGIFSQGAIEFSGLT